MKGGDSFLPEQWVLGFYDKRLNNGHNHEACGFASIQSLLYSRDGTATPQLPHPHPHPNPTNLYSAGNGERHQLGMF